MSAKAWTLSIIALPVVYLAAMPPLAHVTGNDLFHPGCVSAAGPGWVVSFGGAYVKLAGHPALKTPLTKYNDWWILQRDKRTAPNPNDPYAP